MPELWAAIPTGIRPAPSRTRGDEVHGVRVAIGHIFDRTEPPAS